MPVVLDIFNPFFKNGGKCILEIFEYFFMDEVFFGECGYSGVGIFMITAFFGFPAVSLADAIR